MSTISIDTSGETGRISISGAFDFNCSREFREACGKVLATRNVRHVEVELAKSDYIDSSALGMLLLLREESAAAAKTLKLVHCGETVRQVLQVAHFETLFNIA